MRLAMAVGVIGLGTLAGCEAPREAPREPRVSEVERSMLREEALDLLKTAATDEAPQLRANAIEAHQFAPARAADVVRAGLVDENLGVRYVAAMTAGRLGDESLLPAVRPLLEDGAPSVRSAAVYAVRTLGGEADPTMLGRMLLSDPDPRRRAQAAFILGELGDESAAPMLRDAARRDPSTATLAELRLLRLQIAEALAKLGSQDAIETVRAALYPSRPEELEAAALAAQILGEVGDRRSSDQLIYLIERRGSDRMPAEVRLAAAGALAKLGERGGAFVADEHRDDENPVLRAQSAAVYGLVGRPESAVRLRALMNDPNPLVRVAAAAAAVRMTR